MEFDCARLFVDEICWISPPTGVLCQKKFSGQASWEANCGMNAIYCKPRIGRVENRDCLTWEWIIPRSFISLITFVATDHTKGRTKKFKLKNFTKFNYRRPFGRVATSICVAVEDNLRSMRSSHREPFTKSIGPSVSPVREPIPKVASTIDVTVDV